MMLFNMGYSDCMSGMWRWNNCSAYWLGYQRAMYDKMVHLVWMR
jgi:hypothetical protein